jgi:hypothetical protein
MSAGTGFGGSMRLVEVLHIPECPNHQSLMAALPRIVEDSGVIAIVIERIIADEAAARAARFLGSPTVRVDGIDVDPLASARHGVGLSCRLYRTQTGLQGTPRTNGLHGRCDNRPASFAGDRPGHHPIGQRATVDNLTLSNGLATI